MICKHILLITFLPEPYVILDTQLNGFKYFNTNNFLYYYSVLCTQLNG